MERDPRAYLWDAREGARFANPAYRPTPSQGCGMYSERTRAGVGPRPTRMINKTMNSTCRLCGKTRKLRRSHILPEFLYRPLYDGKHRYFVVSAATDSNFSLQSGLTERLLCGDCEQQL